MATPNCPRAERLGMEVETLSRFERGRHVPSLLTLERLVTVLRSTCGELLDEAPPRPSSDALATNAAILSRWQALDLPNAWLVAGCLFQTVWNLQRGHRPDQGIKDFGALDRA